jgi:hypothetical protein
VIPAEPRSCPDIPGSERISGEREEQASWDHLEHKGELADCHHYRPVQEPRFALSLEEHELDRKRHASKDLLSVRSWRREKLPHSVEDASMIVKSFILNPARMHLLSGKASSHQEEPRQDASQLPSSINRCI